MLHQKQLVIFSIWTSE